MFRVIVNLRVHECAVNYPLVVQSHGGNGKFFWVAMGESIRVKVARDAGFNGIFGSHLECGEKRGKVYRG